MLSPIVVSRLSSVIKAGLTSVFALAILVSCSDSSVAPRDVNAPNVVDVDPSRMIEVVVPDAVKLAYWAEMDREIEPSFSRNMSVSANLAVSGLAANAAGSLADRSYTKSKPDFALEPAPINLVPAPKDDGVYKHQPIGFDFEFYGKVYSTFNVYMNGFISFDPNIPLDETGVPLPFWASDTIPEASTPNGIIALGWFDLNPEKGGSISFETRGVAPNRYLVVQFTNVPENFGTGRLTSQVILSETSNTIRINTTQLRMTKLNNKATQGIENSGGTMASFDSSLVSNVWRPRFRLGFSLANDAVMFSPPPPNKAPVTLVPGDVSVNTTPGKCDAPVQVGYASVTDDAPGASVVGGVRSDGLALDALYPKGVTTIAWTSIDVEEKTSTANQLITVSDAEKPSITIPADITAVNDPLRGSAVLVAGNASAVDQCGEVSITPTRSDNLELSAPFPVGLTTITWTAKDGSGNTASANQTVKVVDIEAPRITASDIEIDATSRSGAVVESYNLVFGDNVRVVQVKCTPEPGSLFREGPTPVECTVWDAAGHSASANFVVKVRGAAEQIGDVIGYIETLEISSGAGNPLMNQLRAAIEAIEQENSVSCKKIDDFLRLLTDRKKSSEISYSEMFEIMEDAKRIKAVLGCS
jgi:hypothetical protein